jgi:hypothetical protein
VNEKILNEGNQIHNFISSSGSDFLTNYGSGSGSTSQKVTVPTVPVPVLLPQNCFAQAKSALNNHKRILSVR